MGNWIADVNSESYFVVDKHGRWPSSVLRERLRRGGAGRLVGGEHEPPRGVAVDSGAAAAQRAASVTLVESPTAAAELSKTEVRRCRQRANSARKSVARNSESQIWPLSVAVIC